MEIDWITFGAQLLNFGILLLLLHRFLYRPVLTAVDRREEEIAARLEEAARERAEAREELQGLQEEREALEGRRAALVREAEEEADRRREELGEEIREEAEQARQAWRDTIRRQRKDFMELLRGRMARRFYGGVRKALADLADRELEARVVEVFLERLASLPEEERRALAEAHRTSEGPLRVRTAFELSEERWREVEEGVAAALGAAPGDLELRHRQDPDLGVGLELTVGDRRVGWSAAAYLDELEAETLELLTAEAG